MVFGAPLSDADSEFLVDPEPDVFLRPFSPDVFPNNPPEVSLVFNDDPNTPFEAAWVSDRNPNGVLRANGFEDGSSVLTRT